MSNEFYEFVRIILYPVAGGLLIHLGVIERKVKPALYAVALQFILRCFLLVIGVSNPEEAREISNYTSTPSLALVVIVIFVNIWMVRKD